MAETPSSAGLPRTFWLLLAGMLVNRVGSFVLPFLSVYLETREGFGAGAKSLVLSSWGLGTILAGLIGGPLVDRVGRKPTMLLGLLGGGLVLFCMAHLHSLVGLALSALLLGSVAELYRPAVAATITDTVPLALRPRAFAYLHWIYNVGFAISPLVAGWLIAHAGYYWLFVGDSGTMIAAGVFILLLIPETRPERAEAEILSPVQMLRAVWVDRLFRPVLPAALLLGTVVIQMASTLALVMAEDGIDAELYGRLIALNGLIIALLQPWIVRRLERFDRQRLLPVVALVFGCGFASHALAGGMWGHALSIVIWSLGEIALFPLCNALVSDLAPEHLRGSYQGTYWMAWASANVIGPTLGLQVLARGGTAGWGAMLVCASTGAALAFRVWSRRAAAARPAGTIPA